MATMTILEAEHILDIIIKEVQNTSHRHHPVSALEGHDICQIETAAKLRIANEFLACALRSLPEERFAEGVKVWEGVTGIVMLTFVPDDQVDKVGADLVFDLDPATMAYKDKRLGSLETGSSFANYCRSVGAKDPLYWQKIYTRIGLEYTAESPRGNQPVFF